MHLLHCALIIFLSGHLCISNHKSLEFSDEETSGEEEQTEDEEDDLDEENSEVEKEQREQEENKEPVGKSKEHEISVNQPAPQVTLHIKTFFFTYKSFGSVPKSTYEEEDLSSGNMYNTISRRSVKGPNIASRPSHGCNQTKCAAAVTGL